MRIKKFTNCQLVKGYNRSLIYDLQRKKLHFIPNDLYDVLEEHEGKTIEEIKTAYQHKFDSIIDEYFDFLLKNEIVFLTDTPDWFPELNFQFDSPFEISNAIIDRNSTSSYSLFQTLDKLSSVRCKF